jgi:HEAT repeat protein
METIQKYFRFSKRLRTTLGGRWFLGVWIGLTILLFAAGFIAFSVWIEDRFPSDDPNHSLVPRLQRVLTKPIVNAVSQQVERYIRNRMEAPYMNTGFTLEETISRFLNEKIDMGDRKNYAYRLARESTPQAIEALVKVFQMARPEDRAFMAQLIGSTRNHVAKELLWPLLDDADQKVVLAALRGLSTIGGADVSNKLGMLLADLGQPESIRIEAARGLGDMGTPAERDVLIRVLVKEKETDVGMEILNSLGRFSFPMVADTFEQYLSAPETPGPMRVAAVESLAQSSKEVVPFLLGAVGNDMDPDVRASAAWAISVHGAYGQLGPTLTDLAEQETDADVRRRLYEALLPQSGIPADRLLPKVLGEDDIAARVAGFNVLGSAVRRSASVAVTTSFDQQIVPELLQIATSENSLNIRMRAVFALRQAQTAAAQAALAEIANTPTSQIAEAARHGLQALK